jgi:hypothetical protein
VGGNDALRARLHRPLPDLAVWLRPSDPPIAIIAESGGRREDREKLVLEGWRDAILHGQYAAVQYHCASASVVHWISRMAERTQLTSPAFVATVQMNAEQIAALPPAATDVDEQPAGKSHRSDGPAPLGDDQVQIAAVPAQLTRAAVQPEPPARPSPEDETPEAAAEREQRYREIFGIREPQPRRLWRR